MLTAGIVPAWTPPTLPDVNVPGVTLGPRPNWSRATILGVVLGVLTVGVTTAILASRSAGSRET